MILKKATSFVLAATLVALLAAMPTAGSPGQQASDSMDPLLAQSIGFYTGTTGQVDDPRAHDLLIDAAEDGDTLSQMWLARVYSRGRMLFDEDRAKAAELAGKVIDDVRAMAEADHHEAAFLMGTAYAEGLGVDTDQPMAMAWYARGAKLGNVLSAHNLANAFRTGDGQPRDAEMAAYWYRVAAEQGDALTAFWLGQMYERGQGVDQDMDEALLWYRNSAGRGNGQAKTALERLGK